MSITAMTQALAALERIEHPDQSDVIQTLRQAIAELEKQEHEFVCGKCVKCGASIEKQEPVAWYCSETNQAFTLEPPPSLKAQCNPLYTHPQPKAEQEPEGWLFRFPTSDRWHYTPHPPHDKSKPQLIWKAVYTHPPKRD